MLTKTFISGICGALLTLCALSDSAQALSGPSHPPANATASVAPSAGINPPPGAALEAGIGPSDGVAAIVNDSIITEYDVNQRMLLFIATSGSQVQPSPEVRKKLRDQILKQLETEQLQIQEARHKNITVSPADVDKSIERITTENHLTKEQLTGMLSKAGVEMGTLRAQIAVQIAWQKAVEDEFGGRVNITPADVDAELARISEGATKTHYLVSEIFLPVDNSDLDAKVLKDAQDIGAQLNAGAGFTNVARQFSQSPTAASGGDLGWVYQGQLPTEIDQALQNMQPGSVSPPIRSNGGYYILGLRDRQLGAGTHIPDPATIKPEGPLRVVRLLLPIGPTPAKPLLDNVTKIAEQIHEHINGCDTLDKLQQQVRGIVVQDISKMGVKITDLSPEIQQAITKAGPGETTLPFRSPAGVELMLRCDKRAPVVTAFTIPARNQVEEQLFDDQITMLSRRYLRDLRRSANVETK